MFYQQGGALSVSFEKWSLGNLLTDILIIHARGSVNHKFYIPRLSHFDRRFIWIFGESYGETHWVKYPRFGFDIPAWDIRIFDTKNSSRTLDYFPNIKQQKTRFKQIRAQNFFLLNSNYHACPNNRIVAHPPNRSRVCRAGPNNSSIRNLLYARSNKRRSVSSRGV